MTKKRVLWALSSVGYAHVMRDIAIIARLQEMADFELDMLVPLPLYGGRFLERFNVLKESARLQGSGQAYERVFSQESDEFDLIQFIKEDAKYHKNDCEVTNEVLGKKRYDLFVADEAFWVLSGLAANWIKKDMPVVYISEFVGMKAMIPTKANLNFFRNQNACFLLALNLIDEFYFIGDERDIPDEPFSQGLPNQRSWSGKHCICIGSIVDIDVTTLEDRASIRRRLDIADLTPVYLGIISSPSSENRKQLHDLISSAFQKIHQSKTDAKFILIDPKHEQYSLDKKDFITYKGFVENIYEYMKISDFVVTQSGLTKITALALLNKPFISFPLDYHFENEFYTRIRISNYNVGKQLLLRETDSDRLYTEILNYGDHQVDTPTVQFNRGEIGAKHILKYLV